MILANTRQHLTRNDAQLAMRILAHGSDSGLSELEARLSNDGIDAVLDQFLHHRSGPLHDFAGRHLAGDSFGKQFDPAHRDF